MPSSPPDLSTVPGAAIGRALVRWLDPDRPRRLAERRVGHPLQVAVPLHVRRGSLGHPGRRLLVALADDTVYLLAFRDARPVGISVGGAVAALPRDELAAHFRSRLGRVRAELSWPHRQTFIAGDLPRGAATDELVGLVAADELGRLTA